MDEKTILINTIITKMGPVLQSDQLDYLYNILTISLHDYDVTQEKNEIIEYDDFDRFLCEQYYASLKVEGKSPKTIDRFRVSRITHLVDRGMPLQDVQELAGHTSINTTRSYYRNTLENVKHSYLKAAQ